MLPASSTAPVFPFAGRTLPALLVEQAVARGEVVAVIVGNERTTTAVHRISCARSPSWPCFCSPDIISSPERK